MEEYNKIYPELLTKEPPKDGNAFRLQQSCRVLENLEKKQNITQVSGKSTKDVTTYCREPAHYQELFRLSQRVWSWNSIFWGWPASRRITWRPWSYLWSFECYHWRSWKKCFSESDETRKTVSICESKINSLKDRISKALADDRISNEEFENILAEMSKYHELKKDIRVGLKKTRSKKRRRTTKSVNYAERFVRKYSKN